MPQMNEAALRGLLGLCQRAGKLQSGGDMALAAIRSGKARVAVVDAQASANTVKKITDACIYYHVPLLTLPDGLLGEDPVQQAHHQRAIAAGVASGAAEIQLNLIARRWLELPGEGPRR